MSLNSPLFPALTLNKGLELEQGYPSAQGTTPMRARPGSPVVFQGQLDQGKCNSACPFSKACVPGHPDFPPEGVLMRSSLYLC